MTTKDTGSPKIVNSNLETALFGTQFAFGEGFGSQVSQLGTLFKNNRWFLVTNMRQLLSEIYVEHGIIKTVVDVPVDDAFRGGVEIKSGELSPEDIEQLTIKMDREGDLLEWAQGCKWQRLFGGAAILIMTDQDPITPLNAESLKKGGNLEFKSVDLWELFFTQYNENDTEPVPDIGSIEYFNYYGVKIHKSRVKILKGLVAPSFIRPRLRGWGLSVVEDTVRSINQYLKSTDLSFEVLDEFKVDVLRMEGLNNSLASPNGAAQIHKRVQIANQQKNYQNSIVLDKEDEYEAKQLSFTGISEAMAGIRMQIAADLRMPLTKIFGMSSAGFNSGEDDIENYNSMVESSIRSKVKYDILTAVELRCQQLFGFIPQDLQISFKPLRMLSAEQEENVKEKKFNRLLMALERGAISQEQFADACNKAELLPIEIDPESFEQSIYEQDQAVDEHIEPSDTTEE
tara:strand:- start:32597 stop:33967 length:1371 start_codon:yes stop_codon:yes gene_type:complete